MAKFGVITKVADPSTGGNLAAAMQGVWIEVEPATEANDYQSRYESAGVAALLTLRVPVFVVGEVLLLGSDGRELAGHGRKPSKWDVECETFDDLDAALARAEEVTQ